MAFFWNNRSTVIHDNHYARVAMYRILVSAVLLLTALAAILTAFVWPMNGRSIQSSFFLSLVGSSLTLFGIVFTLCLIGTQLIATRTNVTVKRTFGILTWFYLALFLATTLWTLEISYYAGDANASPVICKVLAHHQICISEVRAGRISVFGLSWSLLLLLPFVIYMYYRLTPRYLFTTLVSSSLRARSAVSFKLRCRRMSDEIMSVAADSRALAEGLSQLLELGKIGVRRKESKGSLTSDDIAKFITEELNDLNYKAVQDKAISPQTLQTFEKWILWLISGVRHPRYKSSADHSASPRQVGDLARMVVKLVNRNLQLWETSSNAPARESLHLLQEMVQACVTAEVRVRVRISEATIQLADCVVIKLVDGPRVDFNLAFGRLIRLCELTMSPGSWSLGGKVAVRQITRTLKNLGESSYRRDQISSWVLDKLHNLTGRLSVEPLLDSNDWDEFLRAIAVLKDEEIRTVLRGPVLQKSHDCKGISHAWEAAIIAQLYTAKRSAALITSQATAIGLCTNISDLPGLVALFEQLSAEYIDNDAAYLEIRPLLEDTSDYIRSTFNKNPLIVSSRRQRFINQQRPTETTEPGNGETDPMVRQEPPVDSQ
jgi:hypothetical protein